MGVVDDLAAIQEAKFHGIARGMESAFEDVSLKFEGPHCLIDRGGWC